MKLRCQKRWFLFDLDGTLLDSNHAHASAFARALAAEGLDVPFDYDAIRGLDTPASFRRLGVGDPALVARLSAAKRAFYREHLREGGARLHAGAAELLDGLAADGAACLLVTSASRASAEQALLQTGITRHFRALVTADDVTASKPAPEPFLRALAIAGADPAACLTVEDSLDGALASTRAGIDVVLVHRPSGAADAAACAPLAPLAPLATLATLADLHRHLLGSP